MRGVAIECDCGQYASAPRGCTIECKACGRVFTVSVTQIYPTLAEHVLNWPTAAAPVEAVFPLENTAGQ